MINPGWQIKTIFQGRPYEMYEVINPEGRQVWVGTLEGLEELRRSVVMDLSENNPAPSWAVTSILQLRDRIVAQVVKARGGAA